MTDNIMIVSFKKQRKFVEKLLKNKRDGKISPKEFMESLLSRTYYNDTVFERGKGKAVSVLLAEAYGDKVLSFDEYTTILDAIEIDRM